CFCYGHELYLRGSSARTLSGHFEAFHNGVEVLFQSLSHVFNITNCRSLCRFWHKPALSLANARSAIPLSRSCNTSAKFVLSKFARGRGGTGRRAGLRSLFPQGSGSSILLVRTKNRPRVKRTRGFFHKVTRELRKTLAN